MREVYILFYGDEEGPAGIYETEELAKERMQREKTPMRIECWLVLNFV